MSSDFWKKIWDKKGLSESTDLLFLDGYEHLKIQFSSFEICKKIISLSDIKVGDSILEVGCGAGFLSREFQNDYNYVGVDYSSPIIDKHRQLFPKHEILVSNSNDLPFANEHFDFVFCFGLFQYLKDMDHAKQTISEMYRVSKNGIFLGDLKSEKTRKEHFVYPKKDLQKVGFQISECVYDSRDVDRFNAVLMKRGNK
tara:strand:+ start:393 stop:986 length:594 start_codon:yes stop_codon:yes gene_type:complete